MVNEVEHNDTSRALHPKQQGKVLISCGILKDEVEAALENEGLKVPVFYLAPAPCVEPQALEVQLTKALRRSAEIADEAVVLIGLCHRDIDAIIAAFNAHRLPINDCFDALLGYRRRDVDRGSRTFYTLPSWLRHWRRALVKKLGWDEADARQNFGLYERIVLLDAGVQSFSDEEVLEFFDFTGVPIDIVQIDLVPLGKLLRESLK